MLCHITSGWFFDSVQAKKCHGVALADDHEQPCTANKKASGTLRQGMYAVSFLIVIQPPFTFHMHVLSCNTHQSWSCGPQWLPYIQNQNQNHETPVL